MSASHDSTTSAPSHVRSDSSLLLANVSRRGFLAGVSAVGGLVLAVGFPAALRAADPPKYGDRKSTRLNSSHRRLSRMPSSA